MHTPFQYLPVQRNCVIIGAESNSPSAIKGHNFCTVTAIYTPGLKGQMLAVHLRQGQNLWLVIQCHNCKHCIGAGTLPRHAEGICRATSNTTSAPPCALCSMTNRLAAFRGFCPPAPPDNCSKIAAGQVFLTENDLLGCISIAQSSVQIPVGPTENQDISCR